MSTVSMLRSTGLYICKDSDEFIAIGSYKWEETLFQDFCGLIDLSLILLEAL